MVFHIFERGSYFNNCFWQFLHHLLLPACLFFGRHQNITAHGWFLKHASITMSHWKSLESPFYPYLTFEHKQLFFIPSQCINVRSWFMRLADSMCLLAVKWEKCFNLSPNFKPNYEPHSGQFLLYNLQTKTRRDKMYISLKLKFFNASFYITFFL